MVHALVFGKKLGKDALPPSSTPMAPGGLAANLTIVTSARLSMPRPRHDSRPPAASLPTSSAVTVLDEMLHSSMGYGQQAKDHAYKVFNQMPMSYGFHNLDCRCALLEDGTEHTYFALLAYYPLKLITSPMSPAMECDVSITTSPPPTACSTLGLRCDSNSKAISEPLATPVRSSPLSATASTSTLVAVADHATAAALCVDFSLTTTATTREDDHHKFKHAPQVANMMINLEVLEAETIVQKGQSLVGTKEDQELLKQSSTKLDATIWCNKKWVLEMQRKREQEVQRELKHFFHHTFDLFDEMPEFVVELRNDNGSVTSNFDHSLEDTSEYLNETLIKDDDICLDSLFFNAFNLFDEVTRVKKEEYAHIVKQEAQGEMSLCFHPIGKYLKWAQISTCDLADRKSVDDSIVFAPEMKGNIVDPYSQLEEMPLELVDIDIDKHSSFDTLYLGTYNLLDEMSVDSKLDVSMPLLLIHRMAPKKKANEVQMLELPPEPPPHEQQHHQLPWLSMTEDKIRLSWDLEDQELEVNKHLLGKNIKLWVCNKSALYKTKRMLEPGGDTDTADHTTLWMSDPFHEARCCRTRNRKPVSDSYSWVDKFNVEHHKEFCKLQAVICVVHIDPRGGMILVESESLAANVYLLTTIIQCMYLAQDMQLIYERFGANVLTQREENSVSNYDNVSCQICKYRTITKIPSLLNYLLMSTKRMEWWHHDPESMFSYVVQLSLEERLCSSSVCIVYTCVDQTVIAKVHSAHTLIKWKLDVEDKNNFGDSLKALNLQELIFGAHISKMLRHYLEDGLIIALDVDVKVLAAITNNCGEVEVNYGAEAAKEESIIDMQIGEKETLESYFWSTYILITHSWGVIRKRILEPWSSNSRFFWPLHHGCILLQFSSTLFALVSSELEGDWYKQWDPRILKFTLQNKWIGKFSITYWALYLSKLLKFFHMENEGKSDTSHALVLVIGVYNLVEKYDSKICYTRVELNLAV